MATKRLEELKVSELRTELEERDADTSGKKTILQDRLLDLLINEGEDPEKYLFQVQPDSNLILETLKRITSNFEALIDEIANNSKACTSCLLEPENVTV